MAAPQHRNFDPAEDFPSVVMDALQKFLAGGGEFLVRIKPGAANTLQVPAADDNNSVVAIAIEGKWRFVVANVEQAGAGGAGLRDVWVVTSANAYAPGTPGEVDTTDYTFQMRVTAVGAPPAGFAHIRKVAQALWSGAVFQDVVPFRNGVLVDPEGARPGTIKPWPFSWAPIGWVFCDSAALAAASPSTLRDQLLADASKFGVSGADPRVPDVRGRVLAGQDAAQTEFDVLGEAPGAKTVTLDATMIPAHTHADGTLAAAAAGSHSHGGATVGSGDHVHTPETAGYNFVLANGTVFTGVDPLDGGGTLSSPRAAGGISYGVNSQTSVSGGHAHGIAADGSHGHDVTGATAQNTGGGQPHNNVQPSLVVNYVIKL